MTGKVLPPTWVAMGAFELKRRYQLNMMIATFSVTLLTAALVAVAALIGCSEKVPIAAGEDSDSLSQYDFGRIVWAAPPTVEGDQESAGADDQTPPDGSWLVEAVAGDEVDPKSRLLNRTERRSHWPSAGQGRAGSLGGIKDLEEKSTEPVDFQSVQFLPKVKNAANPVYPKMARKSGLEGRVEVSVLIGVDGRVTDARVLTESGANAGFEESALRAAYETIWEPASQNDRPVAIWVTYWISFRLKR